jgi:two-component system sensor histidine kinase BaeS
MLASLRSKLVISHFVVILLAFILTIAIASVPIRRAQEARLRNGLTLSAETLARQIDLTRQLSPDSDLLDDETVRDFAIRLIEAEQRRTGNRILVARPDGTVMVDTNVAGSFEGQRLAIVSSAIERLSRLTGDARPTIRPSQRVALALDASTVDIGEINDREAVVGGTAASTLGRRNGLYPVVIASRQAPPLVDDVIRPLAVAASIALGVSILIAFLLSRSVTGPLRRLTATASAISAGELDTRVPVGEGGEVGTLVEAFNGMLDRLAGAYRSQRELLANIAHELRTPLTSIQGYAQALRDGVVPTEDERDDALLAITEEATRMGDLVEQILQLSRLESGQLPLRLQRVRIEQLFEQLRRQFAPIAVERGVQLVTTQSDELEVVADPNLLFQALGNLAGNALRHTPPGGTVELRSTRIASATRPPDVRISVSDTGEGIDSAQLERVFERFYRAGDRATSPGERNFGLGLAIVHEVVERHAGMISVESRPGQGTTFTLDIPIEPPGWQDEPA